MNKVKQFFLKLFSYIKPIDTGIHTTCGEVVPGNSIRHEELLKLIEEEVYKARETMANRTSIEVTLDKPSLAILKAGVRVEILSITIPKKTPTTMIKLRILGTKEVIRMSTNTFNKLFELKQ